MNQQLRISLWNLIYIHLEIFNDSTTTIENMLIKSQNKKEQISYLLVHFFKFKINKLPSTYESCLKEIEYKFDNLEWNQVYDFLEFILLIFEDEEQKEFTRACNVILESENSAYRFIGKFILEISSPQEMQSIEESMQSAFPNVNRHMEKALYHLSNKEFPDYGNSIKESISAVEALVKSILREPKKTLGQLTKSLNLHPALQEGLNKIYGYTSYVEGIRHGLNEKNNTALTYADALFFLVICSAFINYVITRHQN